MTLRLGFQPLGREILSWYSAGSQRVKGVLEDPQRVFFLGKKTNPLFFFLLHTGVPICDIAAQHFSKAMLAFKKQERARELGGKSLTRLNLAPGAKKLSSQLAVGMFVSLLFPGSPMKLKIVT